MTEFTDLGVGNGKVRFRVAKVAIPAASVVKLNATPYELVPAPSSTGRGDVWLEFMGAFIHKPAGKAYDTIHADDEFLVKLGTTSVSAELEATGFMDQAKAQTRNILPLSSHTMPLVNTALNLTIDNSEILNGTSPLYVTVLYREWSDVTVAP